MTREELTVPTPLTELPRSLRAFLWASIGLTIASFLFSFAARHLGFGLPYSSPYYFVPNDRFGDLYGFVNKYSQFGTPAFFKTDTGYFMYPAPMVYVFKLFFTPVLAFKPAFLLMLLLIDGFLVGGLLRILHRAGLRGSLLAVFVTGMVMLSYPLIFVSMRWNIEILIFALTSFGIWAFWREHFYTAAALFGLAASLKFFPFIFFGLLFARKRYKETAAGVAVALLVTLVSLHRLGPTIPAAFAWDNLQMDTFRRNFAGIPSHLGYDHSFFAFIKWIMLPWKRDLTSWVSPYTRAAAVCGLLLYFARIWKMPQLNQILAISILAVTLAPTSYDYTLLSLYPALLLLALRAIEEARTNSSASPLTPFFLLFAVILTPLSFVVWNGGRYAGPFRLLALVALLLLALARPLSDLTSWAPARLART